MNNKQHTRNFTRSDDALILEQPVTRIGLKTLATMLRTSQEKVMRRCLCASIAPRASTAIVEDRTG